MEIVRVDEVSVTFGASASALLAVDRASLTVRECEFLCLVGPSGCGKSTLLKVIAGLTRAAGGSVTVEGIPASPDAVMVWQDHTLIPWRTIRDNVAFGLELKGVPARRRHEAAETALASLGLASFANYFPRQLSGGMRQRAGIARALVANPRILLMDEPFAAVDAQTRRILQEQVLELTQTLGKTVIFVTHSIEEALLLGDRVAVMSARPGRIRDVIDVPFARPRDPSIRRSAAFHELEEEIWLMLRAEAVQAELDT